MLDYEESLLLLVDFQEKLRPAMEGGEESIKRAHILAQAARQLDVPVLASEQNPAGLGATVSELAPLVDHSFSKACFSAAGEEVFQQAFSLGSTLSLAGKTIIICGWESHVCVMQTALALKAKGHHPVIVEDAVASRHVASKETALRRFAHHGVEIVNAEMVLFEWLRTYQHPAFRELAKLIR